MWDLDLPRHRTALCTPDVRQVKPSSFGILSVPRLRHSQVTVEEIDKQAGFAEEKR
jgi:hypothetical protein